MFILGAVFFVFTRAHRFAHWIRTRNREINHCALRSHFNRYQGSDKCRVFIRADADRPTPSMLLYVMLSRTKFAGCYTFPCAVTQHLQAVSGPWSSFTKSSDSTADSISDQHQNFQYTLALLFTKHLCPRTNFRLKTEYLHFRLQFKSFFTVATQLCKLWWRRKRKRKEETFSQTVKSTRSCMGALERYRTKLIFPLNTCSTTKQS